MSRADKRKPPRARLVRGRSFERLEPRTMLDIHLANINFQLAGAPIPSGYFADTGLVYGDRGNGLIYGWNRDLTAYGRDRNNPASLDQRYDTLQHMQRPEEEGFWEIEVPDGTYRVRVVMGDPSNNDSVYAVNVEGVLAVQGTPTPTNRFFSGTAIVNVADERLTISNASAAFNNKIAFVEIFEVSSDWDVASGDLTQGGIASASPGTSPGNETPAEGFDNDAATKFLRLHNPTPAAPIYLNYDFAGTAAYAVSRYTLTSGNDFSVRDPRDFLLQGSNNGTTWTTVDVRGNLFFTDRFETKSFVVGSPTAYSMYRLAISESADPNNDRPQLAELQLFDDVTGVPAAPGNLAVSALSTSQIQLTWSDTSNNEAVFRIERRLGTSGAFEVIADRDANQTSYVDADGLLAGTQYSYRMLAFNSAGDSPYSQIAVATTHVPAVTVNPLATADPNPPLSGTINDATASITVTVTGNNYTAQNHGNGTWTLADNVISPPLIAGVYDVQVSAADGAGAAGNDATTGELAIHSSVANRQLFYNNSRFDSVDDVDAIATGKAALLPGQTANFTNYSSYSRGINGVSVDFDGLPAAAALTAADFLFWVGNNGDPASWTLAPPPASVSTIAGPGGSRRVLVIWPDNAIQNRWLQVTVKANSATELLAPDVFYFGSAIGESGNSTTDAFVTALDQSGARNNPRSFPNFAAIDNPYDFNHDGLVSTSDQNIARNHFTGPGDALQLIAPTVAPPTVTITATDAAAGETGNNPGVFTVARTGNAAGPLTASYVVSGTAVSGSDYATLSGSITIPVDALTANITVTPINDTLVEGPENVVVTLSTGPGYAVGAPASATVVITSDDANNPPNAPIILEPSFNGQVVSGQAPIMATSQFSDRDAGDMILNADWEIYTTSATPQRVWSAIGITGEATFIIDLGDGVFEGSHAGRTTLLPETNYRLRVRHRDDSGEAQSNTSPWSERLFVTRPLEPPTAPGWVARQPGYRIEEIPFTFPPGELQWRLPVNIAFVPPSVHRTGPNDPLFYVNELYGTIRVVTNNLTVRTFADGVLNYNPTGPISGSGENGLTGLVVDPLNGDVFAAMLYDDPNDGSSNTFPKVTRYTSANGGISAIDTDATQAGTQGTDILRMFGEPMRQSHIVSNLSFGPDDKLYVHVGDGFDASTGQNALSFRGKILRLNRDGLPLTDNPQFNPADRGNDGRPDAEDYWYARGLRNPFGGAWRDADAAAGRAAQHFTVENGPSRDRLSVLVRDRNYLYDGSDASMNNFNIAFSPTGGFENGAPDWSPSPAPVNITFIQASSFNNSQFPLEKRGHAFVTHSGTTHASGPNSAKSIEEWVFNNDGTRRVSPAGQPANPRELITYEGSGYSTAAGLAAGPDGLYFSTLYPDSDPVGTNRGAKILRVIYVGAAAPAPVATHVASEGEPSAVHTRAGSATSQQSLGARSPNSSALDTLFAEDDGRVNDHRIRSPGLTMIATMPVAQRTTAAGPLRPLDSTSDGVGHALPDGLTRRRVAAVELFHALERVFGDVAELVRRT